MKFAMKTDLSSGLTRNSQTVDVSAVSGAADT